MEDIVFKSSLSQEEIEKNFESIDFFSGIKASLEEVLAYEKGIGKAERSTKDNLTKSLQRSNESEVESK